MKAAKAYADSGLTFVLRSKPAVLRFVTDSGLELIEPGIVPVHHWRPDHRPWALSTHRPIEPERFSRLDDIDKIRYRDINDVTDDDINVYGLLARKS